MIEFELPDPQPEPPPPPIDPETRIADETQVEALKNDFIARQQQVLYSDPEALFRLEGDAAIAGGVATTAKLAEARDELLGRAVNPVQHTMLARSLDQHLALAGEDIQRHTNRQRLLAAAWPQDRFDLLRQRSNSTTATAACSKAMRGPEARPWIRRGSMACCLTPRKPSG